MLRWAAMLSAALVLTGCAAPGRPAPAPAPARTAAPERPIPYPVTPPAAFQRAIERGTRTATGEPGPRYWQSWARYTLRARVLPAEKRLEGSGEIVYHNRSPDALNQLHLELLQNHHAPGVVRNEPAEVTGGVQLRRVALDGRALAQAAQRGASGYLVAGTRLVLFPEQPLAPGDSARIALEWSFAIPQRGIGGRMGHSRDNLLYLAYWYPQMAVYDDVGGWHTDPFRGMAEFYSGFARYDLTVEAPAGWLALATGALQNPAEVLAAPIAERLALAERSDTVVRVVTAADLQRATRTGSDGWLRWRFAADSVRDVAFSLSRASLWDAVRTPVGDRDGDGRPEHARIDALYRPEFTRWRHAARYGQHAIAFLSRATGVAYPWPNMAIVEGDGIIGGGMEYPMMTLIGGYQQASDEALYSVTAHELAHMWVPMIASTDERRYSWMDEGVTSFNTTQAQNDFFPGGRAEAEEVGGFLQAAQAGLEVEIMRLSDFHYTGGAFGVASYAKPASALIALRAVLGEESFNRGYRDFLRRWAFKHPLPWDLWNSFERESGRDLDWFWRGWFYEPWTLDQAVESVTSSAQGTTITVRDMGLLPMPVQLTITREGGATEQREIPVEAWLRGARTATLTLPAGPAVTRVEIDAARAFADTDRGNNVWSR